MKRQILTMAAVLALVLAGAVFAQSPQNTTAPGPTTQQEPGLTNNNLPNPGNPVPDPNAAPNQPAQDTATQTGTPPATTVTEPAPQTTTTTETTTTTTEPAPETTTTETTTGTETETTSSAGTYGNENAALPSTASDLPTVALLGLLALGAAFVLRLSKRNA